MSTYVDGFVLVIPEGKAEEYKKMAEGGRDLWMKHGAVGYYECKGDDLTPQTMGGDKLRRFTEMTNAQPNETVWFSFIIFKSKAHRDEVNAKVTAEMHQQEASNQDLSIPFDMQRMAYGGFIAEVES